MEINNDYNIYSKKVPKKLNHNKNKNGRSSINNVQHLIKQR